MTTQTLYFTSVVIGLFRRLHVYNSDTTEIVGLLNGVRAGIRVWKIDSLDVETEITLGVPVATAIYIDDGEYVIDWDSTETSLDLTDRIIVRFYEKTLTGAWTLKQVFITSALNATKLDAATWTVRYWLYKPITTLSFFYGKDTYPSRIENFTFSVPVSGSGLHGNCAVMALSVLKSWIDKARKRRFIATFK